MPPQRCDDIILIEPDLELIIVQFENRRTSHFLPTNVESAPIQTRNTNCHQKVRTNHLKTWCIVVGLIFVGVFTFVMKLVYGDSYHFYVM